MIRTPSRTTRHRHLLESLALDRSATEPLYRQLETQLREAIRTGRLSPGEGLPSTRQLAKDLGVARNTTKNAYNQLIVEGYLVSVAGSGTRVAQDVPEDLLQAPGRGQALVRTLSPVPLSRIAKRGPALSSWIQGDVSGPVRPFRPHTPASDAFPRDLWAQLTARRTRRLSRSLLERGDPRGYRPLREAVAGYLGTARGVACDPGQVVITAGAQQAIELVCKLLIEPGDRVCMEDPGYTPAALLFELAGAEIDPVPVDEEGLEVARLDQLVPTPKLVYVTPASQFPLGMPMSLPRRLALIEWAERRGAVILEDDYNGEYRYAGRPLPALHGLAPAGRVLYAGSFSKLLFPALRIGYLVLPAEAVEPFAAMRWLSDRHSPPLEQAVLADFIEEGHFARHVRRMRTLYAERQGALVEAAANDLAGLLDVPSADAGLHLIGWLGEGVSKDSLLRAAASAGIDLTPTSRFSVRAPARPSVILGYAPFPARQIRQAVQALSRAWEGRA